MRIRRIDPAVELKAGAIRELVRVTRPGDYVGLNEGLWLGWYALGRLPGGVVVNWRDRRTTLGGPSAVGCLGGTIGAMSRVPALRPIVRTDLEPGEWRSAVGPVGRFGGHPRVGR